MCLVEAAVRTPSRDCRRPPGPTAGKVRRLAELGHRHSKIAYILALDPLKVREFLDRAAPLPDGRPRANPRTRTEQKARQAAAKRRRQRERRRADVQAKRATIASWGSTWAAERAEWMEVRGRTEATAPPAAELAADQAAAELPAIAAAPALEAWSGPTSPHAVPGALNGRAKLSDEHVAEIRQERAAGETIAAIAYRFGITPNAVRAALAVDEPDRV